MTMNKMTTTTRAIVTILFIVPKYSIDWYFDGNRTIHSGYCFRVQPFPFLCTLLRARRQQPVECAIRSTRLRYSRRLGGPAYLGRSESARDCRFCGCTRISPP